MGNSTRYTLGIYYLYPFIYLHSGHHLRHLLYTDSPASLTPLLAQWAHTSSFYDTVGLHPHFLTQWAPSTPSTVHRLSNLSSSLTCTVGHTSSFQDTVGLYSLIYLHSEYHPHHLLYTDCPTSVPPLLVQWAHTSSLCDTVGIYPLVYLHSGHHPRHLLYRMSSLTSSLTCTVSPYLLLL